MIKVNTHEAKTKLSALLREVEDRDETVVICRNGKPIAVLSAYRTGVDPMQQHPELQGVIYNEDPAAPLESSDWPSNLR